MKTVTIESLVSDAARAGVSRTDGFRFCSEPSCDVAYFHPETGERFVRGDVKVRIGQKETASSRPVCYCFGHTAEEIETEVARTGTSRIVEDITEKCRQGLDRCEELNPQGACCLGNVRHVMRAAQERRGVDHAAAPKSSGNKEDVCGCAREDMANPGSSGASGLWASAGAVVSAILASACCWLPLLLIAFGLSAGGVAAWLEQYRWWFLGLTAVLLGAGFYFVYFRSACCEIASACAASNRRRHRMNQVMLWVATLFVPGAAAFPKYVDRLIPAAPKVFATANSTRVATVSLKIDGMTCEGCAAQLRSALLKVPGVLDTAVSFPKRSATVSIDESSPPLRSELGSAVEATGYRILEETLTEGLRGP